MVPFKLGFIIVFLVVVVNRKFIARELVLKERASSCLGTILSWNPAARNFLRNSIPLIVSDYIGYVLGGLSSIAQRVTHAKVIYKSARHNTGDVWADILRCFPKGQLGDSIRQPSRQLQSVLGCARRSRACLEFYYT